IAFGNLAYFIREGKPRLDTSAFYIGPARCSDGVHRHLTFVVDAETEDLANLHLTKDDGKKRGKKWSITPENVEPDIVRWIESNSTPVDMRVAVEMNRDYHCISGWRVFASLRLLAGLLTPLEWLIFRPLGALGVARITTKDDHVSRKVRIVGFIDVNRLLQLMKKLRPLRRPVEKLF